MTDIRTRVLVIDDDTDVRAVVCEVLGRAGYDVEVAEDGERGMERFAAQPAPLVITDLIMPRMDGLETIGALRRASPWVKIIAVSGGGRRVNRDYLPAAQALGADRVLYKPFGPSELIDAVRDLLAS